MLADNLEVDGDLLIGGESTQGCCAHWPFTAVDPSMNSVTNGQNEKYVTETKPFFLKKYCRARTNAYLQCYALLILYTVYPYQYKCWCRRGYINHVYETKASPLTMVIVMVMVGGGDDDRGAVVMVMVAKWYKKAIEWCFRHVIMYLSLARMILEAIGSDHHNVSLPLTHTHSRVYHIIEYDRWCDHNDNRNNNYALVSIRLLYGHILRGWGVYIIM